MPKRAHRYMSDEERFLYQTEKSDGCWLWTGARNKEGYGRAHFKKAQVGAHRVSWLITHGSIPDGLCVLHKCDNPPCVNPDHLFLGTEADNATDRDSKGRGASGDRSASRLYPERMRRGADHHWQTKPETRMRGAKNGRAKLTDDQVKTIRSMWKEGGWTKRGLSRVFGVTDAMIGRIIRHEAWPHIQ